IEHFGATTADEFRVSLIKLQKNEMKDLILDLQGNGGGYLNAALDLADEFLEQKELIVYTEGRASKRSDFFAKGGGQFRAGRLVILVDTDTNNNFIHNSQCTANNRVVSNSERIKGSRKYRSSHLPYLITSELLYLLFSYNSFFP
ncbi:hypothetical protein EZS27_035943, partial [termite gut metagenome]